MSIENMLNNIGKIIDVISALTDRVDALTKRIENLERNTLPQGPQTGPVRPAQPWPGPRIPELPQGNPAWPGVNKCPKCGITLSRTMMYVCPSCLSGPTC